MAYQNIARKPVKTRSERLANNLPPHDVDWRSKFVVLELEYNKKFEQNRDLVRNMMDGLVNPYECDHERLEIRKKVIADGRVMYYRQCIDCGDNRKAVKKDSINYDPPEWDYSFEKAREERRVQWNENNQNREQYLKRLEEWRNRCWWNIYNAYLESPSWRWLRARAMERDEYLCQGCGINKAVEVHHFTYQNVGAELLYELVSVCNSCHAKAHAKE